VLVTYGGRNKNDHRGCYADASRSEISKQSAFAFGIILIGIAFSQIIARNIVSLSEAHHRRAFHQRHIPLFLVILLV